MPTPRYHQVLTHGINYLMFEVFTFLPKFVSPIFIVCSLATSNDMALIRDFDFLANFWLRDYFLIFLELESTR